MDRQGAKRKHPTLAYGRLGNPLLSMTTQRRHHDVQGHRQEHMNDSDAGRF